MRRRRRPTTANWPGRYFTEAADLARDIGDSWWLGQTAALDDCVALLFGDLSRGAVAAEEALRIADGIGDGSSSRQCRYVAGLGAKFCAAT